MFMQPILYRERSLCRCERNLLEVSAGCRLMRTRTTMTDMAMVYRRPASVMRQSVKPQLATGTGRGIPARWKLARFAWRTWPP